MEAFNYNPQYDYSEHQYIKISELNKICKYCNALKFDAEAPGLCCANGKVILQPLVDPPNPLKEYTSGETSISKHFMKNDRKYNSTFVMTSFGASKICNNEQYLPTFKIQGKN